MLLGYARVSTSDQTTAPQEEALKAAGCKRIFRDVASGARTARPGLDALLADAREGDTVVVWRLDRLGRSLAHLIETVGNLEKTGRGFRSITESIDTTTPAGRLVFHLFASLAQFERELLHERIRAGVASARARGLTGGRPRALDTTKTKLARKLMADRSRNVNDIARTLEVSRSTLYRLIHEEPQPPAVSTPARTQKASRAERGVPPQAAPQGGRKAASSPQGRAKAENQAKTPTAAKQPRKGTKTTSTKRK